jgi:hypothetical protein
MKTDLDTRDLDARLHTAAGSLHDAVADVPLNGPPSSSGRSPIALGAVLLLVAALTTAAVGATRGDDDGIDVSSQPVAEVRGLVADPVPEGLAVAWAGEQTSAVVDGSGVNADSQTGVAAQTLGLDTYLYGNASAAAGTSPFATADLVANVWDAAEVSAEAGEAAQISALDGLANTTSASVRGHAAQVCAAPDCVADVTADVTTVWWHETETLEVVLASRTLGVDQILAIAEHLVIDADGVLSLAPDAVPNLPGPLDELGVLSDTAVASTREAVAHWVGYVDPANPTGRFVDITTLAGDTAELYALVWELGAQAVVQVRGQDGWIAAGAGAQATAAGTQGRIELIWQEESGVIVHVTALGVGQDELLDLAANLQTASDDEWADIKASVSVTGDETAAAAADVAAGDVSAEVDADVGSGADVEADVNADTGTGVDVDAQVGVGTSDTTGVGVDAEAQVDAEVVGIAADLHADLGTEAVIGAVTDTVNGVTGAVGQVGQGLEETVNGLTPKN